MRRAYSQAIVAGCLLVVVSTILLTPTLAEAQAPATGWESVNNVLKLVVWTITAQFFGFLVWAGGGLLDYTITTFIVEFGRGFQTWGLGFAVNQLWTVVRDLFNLTFIFALVYIGFKMILNSDDSGSKKAIVNLVIAALLVNFSLFFTKAIIDFTNITATQVANVIYSGAPSGSVSGTFMSIMQLPSILAPNGVTGAANAAAQASWSYIIGTMVLCLVASFAFIAGAILIGIRFIALCYFMVISPIMFIGRVFPFLQSWQSNFWGSFLKNAFFAPAFLLMLYFSLYILQNLGGLLNGQGLHAALNGAQSNVNALAVFILASGFLIGSVLLAQKMSVVGGDMAVKVGNQARGKLQGSIGRNSIGWMAQAYDKRLEERGVSERSWRRSATVPLAKGKYGGSYSYKEAGEIDEKAERLKNRKESVDKLQSSVGSGFNAPAGSQARVDMERAITDATGDEINKVLGRYKKRSPEYNAFVGSLSNSQFESLMKAKEEDLSDSDKAVLAQTRASEIKNALTQKGKIELANTAARKEVENQALANNASPADAKRMALNADVTARVKELTKTQTDEAGLAKSLSKASGDQLKSLGAEFLQKNAGALSFSQIDDIKKGKDFTETEKERIVGAHKAAIMKRYNDTRSTAPEKILSGLKDDEVAKLPKEILTDPTLAPHLSIAMLGELVRSLTKEDRSIIRETIAPTPPPGAPAPAYATGSAALWLTNSARGQLF